MKQRLIILIMVFAVILILGWALAAVASSRTALTPTVIEADGVTTTVDLSYDLSGIQIVPERAERLHKIPPAPKADIER